MSLQSKGDASTINQSDNKPRQNNKQEQKYDPTVQVDGWGEINNFEEDKEEDEENSIHSAKTTTVKKKDMTAVVIPKYVRYQLMLPPEEEDAKATDEPGYKDNYERIKSILKTFTTQLSIYDNKAEITSWETTKNFSFLPKGTFPEDVSNIAKFFKGFYKNESK